MSFTIRSGEKKDAQSILNLIIELAVFEKEPNAVEITVENIFQDGFSNNPKFKTFVAEESDGTIIGMAQALGESAPLLIIGMVAFIVDIPQSMTDPSTALPIQIYLWADTPERGFVERTSAAIMVLLLFLIVMNSLAVYLRKKFEKDIN